MEDVRLSFVRSVRDRGPVRVDDGPPNLSNRIMGSLLDGAFPIICSYVREDRCIDKDWGLGRLERDYLFSDEFMKAEDAQRWIDENRETDDIGLIVYIFDNVYDMTPGKHRRSLLYILNILYFGL